LEWRGVRQNGRKTFTNVATESNRRGLDLFNTKKCLEMEKSGFSTIDWTETQREMLDDFLGISK